MKYKEELELLSAKGLTIKEIAKEINLSSTGARYWLKKYSIKTQGNCKSKKWNSIDLEKFVKESLTKSDVLRKMNLLIRPGNFRTFDRYIKLYKIDISHFERYFHNNRFNNIKYKSDEIFVKDSTYTNTKCLKEKLVRENKIEYKCSICENEGKWKNKELKLQLDHINGVNNDNRVENLRFLCPNCHSQTSTFCSKNKKV